MSVFRGDIQVNVIMLLNRTVAEWERDVNGVRTTWLGFKNMNGVVFCYFWNDFLKKDAFF